MFSCEFYEIFKNTFFIEHLRMAASEIITENSQGNSVQNEKSHIT